MIARSTAALLGGTLTGGITAITAAVRLRPRRPAPAAWLVSTEFRRCPKERRDVTAVIHTDGSATCDSCGTHIPAGDS